MKKILIILIVAVLAATFFILYFFYTENNIVIDSQLYFNRPEQPVTTTTGPIVESILPEEDIEEITDEIVVPESVVEIKNPVIFSVPFISQAPSANWSNPIFQDACEESSVIMAMSWVNNENLDKVVAETKILGMADWQQELYGEYRDTSAEDVISRLFNGYFGYTNVFLKAVTSADDIIAELEAGHIIISPMNGQALKNPNFTAPGPERHMGLVKGYDYGTEEFITNDPGTRNGKNYRYSKDLFFTAIRDYATGYHEPFPEDVKNVIIIKK